MSSIRLDDKKKIYYKDFEFIVVGDVVFLDCDGPCSGGATYDIGDVVTKIDKDLIHAGEHRFSRVNGAAKSPPWAYYISFWQRG